MNGHLGIPPELFLRFVLVSVITLAGVGILLVLWTTLIQWRMDRANAERIRCFQRWEKQVPAFLFGDGIGLEPLRQDARRKPELLRAFLQGCRASIQGEDYRRVVDLYRGLGLQEDLQARLKHRSPRRRALAAVEIAAFQVNEVLPSVLPLLRDPHGYVAISAARAFSLSRDLVWAETVLEWVISQPYYKPERLTGMLEAFGPGIIPWLDEHLPSPETYPESWCLFTRLVARHHYRHSLPTLLRLLQTEHPELRAEVLRALAVVGEPQALGAIQGYTTSDDPVLREAAVQALAVVAGPAAAGVVQRMLGDRVYEVRRAASLALCGLGEPGLRALRQVELDEEADPFARDMARERLDSLLLGRRS